MVLIILSVQLDIVRNIHIVVQRLQNFSIL